ncbi:MAG: imidazole glycerol phosphate synthase cyclase subunit [Oscillospiraceae bacterium]|jgi:cyclase|nr:imidazole glycerol phosphate synthase cyclase subunit [Oscillospiraceae bacterium]
MQKKRIIPALDVKNGRVVKGVKFINHADIASPVDLAEQYNKAGADELVFYDITASLEGRQVFSDILMQVKKRTTIPLIVGGGINTLEDIEKLLALGVNKFSINSGAFKNPDFIKDAASEFGSKCIILAVDVKNIGNEYRLFSNGGYKDTGIEAIEWIKRGEDNGAGEVVVNSMDTDGVKNGFDLPLLEAVSKAVSIPIIASGGAGSIEDFITLFKTIPQIDAGLAASIFHYGDVKIPNLKRELQINGIL